MQHALVTKVLRSLDAARGAGHVPVRAGRPPCLSLHYLLRYDIDDVQLALVTRALRSLMPPGVPGTFRGVAPYNCLLPRR